MSMLFGLNPLKIKEDQKGKSPLFYAPNWIFNLLVTIKEKWIFHQQWWQNGDFLRELIDEFDHDLTMFSGNPQMAELLSSENRLVN